MRETSRGKGDSDQGHTAAARPEMTPARVLLVGDLAPEALPERTSFILVQVRPEKLGPSVLAEARPDLVLSPLVGAGYDCFDVAESLVAAGYRGRYRAVVDTLPDPTVVRREVASKFPKLDFDLLLLNPATQPGG